MMKTYENCHFLACCLLLPCNPSMQPLLRYRRNRSSTSPSRGRLNSVKIPWATIIKVGNLHWQFPKIIRTPSHPSNCSFPNTSEMEHIFTITTRPRFQTTCSNMTWIDMGATQDQPISTPRMFKHFATSPQK